MLDEKELQELAEFESEDPPILSLYLDTDLTRQPKEKCKLILRDLLKRVEEEAAKEDAERVESFFDFEHDWQGKGVAIFSCQEKGFWRVFPLAVPVTNQVFVGERAYIKPLTKLLDDYGRYGVILVDRRDARLFLFHMGELHEMSETLGKEVKHHKRGGWAQARYQRHVDELAQQNLRRAAEVASAFYAEGKCRHLILGGTEENIAQFRNMLPKSLQGLVVGSMSIEMDAPEAEVRERSLEVIKEVERESERRLVERVITAATKGGAGVIGLADTLGALREGRIHILVVAEGYTARGYRCQECGYLAAQKIANCPFCGGRMEEISDAVDMLVRRVVEGGGQVEMVKDCEELERAGSIGALLRY